MQHQQPSSLKHEVQEHNTRFAGTFNKGHLPARPSRKAAFLTCMDCRLDPTKFAGLSDGDAHVIRNAGGRASEDAIRSLILSYKLLGTREFFVIHHTQCGLYAITNDVMVELLSQSLDSAELDAETGEWKDLGPPGTGNVEAAKAMDFMALKERYNDISTAVAADVDRIRNHPLIPPSIPVYGFVYEVETGLLNEVPVPPARAG